VYSACELSTASTGYSAASAGAEPKPKGKRIQVKSFKAMLRKERRVREDGILEVLRWNATASANLQHEASESGGACQRRHGDEGRPQEQAGKGQDEMRRRPPQCHGNDGHGHQPAPPQGASGKDERQTRFYALLSAPPELTAAHCALPGDDETARLLLPASMLPPLAASKRSAGALSPTDVALFPASPCTAECSVKEASRGANGAAVLTDEGDQDGHFFNNHPKRGGYSTA